MKVEHYGWDRIQMRLGWGKYHKGIHDRHFGGFFDTIGAVIWDTLGPLIVLGPLGWSEYALELYSGETPPGSFFGSPKPIKYDFPEATADFELLEKTHEFESYTPEPPTATWAAWSGPSRWNLPPSMGPRAR